eukprot:scaffold3.g6257.t1
MRRLEGRVALVTASTAGIGLGIARRLAQEGARVVISSRRQQNVDEAAAALRAEGLDVAGTACHVGDTAQLQRLVDFTLATYGGRIDILVSNAAVNPTSGPILDTDDGALDKILDINVKSPVLLAKAAVPHMRRGGSVVFVSSYTAFNPTPPIAFYAVSKTALLGLTKALAEELGPDGIRSKTLLGRLGTPQDMAGTVAFLVSDDASYITGETIIRGLEPAVSPATLFGISCDQAGRPLPSGAPLRLCAEVSEFGRVETEVPVWEGWAALESQPELCLCVGPDPPTTAAGPHLLRLALWTGGGSSGDHYLASGTLSLEGLQDGEPLSAAIPLVDEVGKHAATASCQLRLFHSRTPGKVRDELGVERIDSDLLALGSREAAKLLNERSPQSPRAAAGRRSTAAET